MATHTQGPFEAPGMDGDAFVICTHKGSGKRRTVAHAYTHGDATLFAAAPDMLAALRRIANAVEIDSDDMAVVLAAVAKAEG